MILWLALGACKSPVEVEPEPWVTPNLLVFLLDDVGIERLNLYGVSQNPVPQTPVFDSLASDGMLFERAYATPLCSSSRASLLTGQLPFRHGVGSALFSETPWELPDESVTLAEALKAHDPTWSTAIFGKWHLTTLAFDDGNLHPQRQGFDHHNGNMLNILDYDAWWQTIDGEHQFRDGYHSAVITESASEWVNAASEPWYAQVNFQGAHAPFHAPPADYLYSELASDAPDPRLYDAMIENLDVGIGLLLDAMDPDVRANTVVVVLGDNGTPFLVAEPPLTETTAKPTLYEGGIRVPLVMSGPGIPPGQTSNLTSITDLFPTLLALTHTPLPDTVLDGRSLIPELSNPALPGPDTLYMEAFAVTGTPPTEPEDRGQAILSTTHKLLIQGGLPVALHRIQPYPEGPDLMEQGGLSEADQTAFDELMQVYEAQEAEVQALWQDGRF